MEQIYQMIINAIFIHPSALMIIGDIIGKNIVIEENQAKGFITK